MTRALVDRYDDRIAGVLSCYDRVVITGTLPRVCYAAGMTGFVYAHEMRIFDYPKFAMTLRDQVRERAVPIDRELGLVYLRTPTSAPFRLQVLLQWPQRAGAAVGGARHRLHRRRQCFRSHRRLGACASARGWLVA